MNYKQYGESPVSDRDINIIDTRLQNIGEGSVGGENAARVRTGRVIGFGLVSIAYAINNCAKVYYEIHKKPNDEGNDKFREFTDKINHLEAEMDRYERMAQGRTATG